MYIFMYFYWKMQYEATTYNPTTLFSLLFGSDGHFVYLFIYFSAVVVVEVQQQITVSQKPSQ